MDTLQMPDANDLPLTSNPAPAPLTGNPAPAPEKPSLWKDVLAGALQGLAGSAGSTSFGGGLARGAGAELNAKAQSRAQAAADAKAADQHQIDEANVANTYANMAHTMAMTRSMNPTDVNTVRSRYQESTGTLIKSGALVAAGQAGEHADVLDQIAKLHKSDPTSLYVPVEVPGPDGKLTWQAFKATKAPLQSDATISMPDKSTRTLPAGSVSGEQAAGVVIGNIKDEAAGMVKQQTPKAGPMKVVPDPKSKTGFSYAAIGADGKLSDIKGEAPAPSAQQFSQTKTIQKFGADGYPHVFAFNPKTNTYDVDQGFSSAGASGHQAAQATAVANAGEDMIKTITSNKAKLGTLSAWVQKHGLNTPIADPDLAGLQAQLSSFAALQPAMHGFRSHSALETFDKIIGGLQQNPDATIASIRGILKVTGNMNPALRKPNASRVIFARDPQGKLHQAPEGTPLPANWKMENQ